MSDSPNQGGGILREISDQLGSVFRHMLPGVVVVGAAHLAYPTAIPWPNIDTPEHLVVLGVLMIVVGNAWFVFNRYGLFQLIDLIQYHLGYAGPAKAHPAAPGACSYVESLGQFVRASLEIPKDLKPLREHVRFRASSVLLMYTVAEATILFSFLNEGPGNFFHTHRFASLIAGLIFLCLAVWQHIITRRIDWYTVHEPNWDGRLPKDGAAHETSVDG